VKNEKGEGKLKVRSEKGKINVKDDPPNKFEVK